MTTAFVWVAVGIGVLLLSGWLLRIISHRMLFKPIRLRHAPPPQFPPDIDFSHAWFTAVDGVRLHGWWCRRAANPTTLLICHGNTGSIEGREDTVEFYMNMGLNVFIFDYRGYGLSAGHPSEEGTYRDLDAAWQYLRKKQHLDADDIVVLGRSLGAAVAAHLAQREQPAAIILESTFTSLPDLAGELHGWSKLLFMLSVRYETASRIGQFRSPLLLVHSREDELIGVHHAHKLVSLAPANSRYLEITGRHRDGFVSSRDQYVPAIIGFLQEYKVALGPQRLETA